MTLDDKEQIAEDYAHAMEVRDLRAEIAALKARAEKAEAEAEVRSGRWCEKNRNEGRGGCGMCGWCCKQSREQRDTALAACAEMRVALEAEQAFADYSKRWSAANPDSILPVGWCFGDGTPSGHGESWRLRDVADAKRNAILSRTDLGRGWASPEVVARCRDAIDRVDPFTETEATLRADLDALLKKGGG